MSLRKKSKRKTDFDRELETMRPQLVDRADYRCELQIPDICIGAWDLGLVVHHRKLRSQGGTNDPVSLLVLCAACHRYVHDGPAFAHHSGWLVHSWEEPENVAITSYRKVES